MSEPTASFGDVLRRLRSEASLSQEELAERAGLSRRGISDLERGAHHAPQFATVRLLADALNLDADGRAVLLAAARPETMATVAAERERPAPQASLPVPATRLIGRETEVAALSDLLRQRKSRLITVTGPGGVGKTRLAIAVAAEMAEAFPDGVVFVDLSPLTDPARVIPTIAAALGVREAAGQPLQVTLATFLASQRLLLVLDNCERVLAAAPDLTTLRGASAGVAILATSREPFHVQGEQEFPLAPLPLPAADDLPETPELAQIPAIALFVERARQVRLNFALTADNAGAVAAICQRLDGLPLAIELAATRIKVLPPTVLLARLEHRLPLLTGGPRDQPVRQQTLRNTIVWSHDLLQPEERVLFRRLSVFVGGWTLEGAEAVSAVDAESTVDPLETLASLIDQSLVDNLPVPSATTDEPRYRMLETIREFATEQLAASGERLLVEHAVEAFLIGYAEEAEQRLKGPDQLLWIERLEAEHDNFRAAMARALERKDGNTALRLAPRLGEFWWARGYRTEGRAWLERSIALADAADPEARAAAEFALGQLLLGLGDYDAAHDHYRKSLDLRRQLGDTVAEAEVLSALAIIAINRLAFADAAQLGEDALRIFRTHGDRRGTATALHALGVVAREQGDYARALELFTESMALWRALGNTAWIAREAIALGITHRLAGNSEQASRFLDTAQALYTELGDRFALAVIACNGGHIAFDEGDVTKATQLYGEALKHFDSVDESEGVVEAIEWLAVAVAAKGEAVPALRLFGAAAAARETLRLPPRIESDEKRVASGIAQATRATGTSAKAVLTAGRAMSLERARDEGLELASAVAHVVP